MNKRTPVISLKHFPTQKAATDYLVKMGLTKRMASMMVSYDRMSEDWMADLIQAAIALETGRTPRYGARPRVIPEDPERIVHRPKHSSKK